MRLSWLDPRTISAAMGALGRPEPPEGISAERWPAVENFVRRAEAVSSVVRTEGLDAAVERYAASTHAVEVAVVIMASAAIGAATVPQIRTLFECDIDEDILYGTFLRLLVECETTRLETVATYEEFLDRLSSHRSDHPQWGERVDVVREGLAELYVVSGRYDAGHDLFAERHEEHEGDLTVALAASRAFLAAGQPARAAEWLGRGAERAKQHGRSEMESRLRDKQRVLEERAEGN